ncbi:hypothetical protein B0T19DRAFT_476000 [Cercophora scortea]|uniref:FAD-binding PCMH-type domain-containing protein n=1 Tax=Cercophora scortea TaxID=314031 RepID=A0AAE0ING8_9PEZI|nr:hypothetical protein B0T19DRAFT_476000 [Cercophora scortea]
MLVTSPIRLAGLFTAALLLLPLAASAPGPGPERSRQRCRYLPGDREWPSIQEWNKLNRTVGGRLIAGVPVGRTCYGPYANSVACAELQDTWGLVDNFLNDPVNVVSPYFENNTCDPFVSPEANALSLCQLGNLASYAINVSDASTVAAGLKFAKEKNIRLVIKNTGHDYLGGSAGKGSLALWTHNLKEITFIQNYTSRGYNGTAVKLGAGVQFFEVYKAASDRGLRVVGGSCPTVGATGGWRQAGGYGPLVSTHGLGADNALSYEVVTVDGRHLTASPQENSDLFWALSGGGAGNYAIVLSAIVKTHRDGPVAGSRLSFLNTNSTAFYSAVEAWMKHMLVLDTIPGFATETLVTDGAFALNLATHPGGNLSSMHAALSPFYTTLAQLNITPIVNNSAVQRGYLEHYAEYQTAVITRNLTVGGRFIPRALAHNNTLLSNLTSLFRSLLSEPDAAVYLHGLNVANKTPTPNYNAVTPAWRNNLFLINVIFLESDHAPWTTLRDNLARANVWQDRLRELDPTPLGGAYINEGTFDNVEWKADYFGGTYERLRVIKAKWDPNSLLYVRPGVGADEFVQRGDGRLCRV